MVNVIFLGLVSFFSDISTEMVYPLIPLYLTSAFGASPSIVGLIEGIAESVAALLKVLSGYITDKVGCRKRVAFCGYAAGLVYKGALVFTSSWGGVLAAKVLDRTGKGLRTAPRDVLVSESAASGKAGGAFGLHKAMDMTGSALGIFISYLLLSSGSGQTDYKRLFALSAIPAVAGLLFMAFVKEKPVAPRRASPRGSLLEGWKKLDSRLRLYLFVSLIFTLGNSSNSFLLLRAQNTGFNDTQVILLYLAYTVTAALLSIPFGRLSDKIGRKSVLVAGYIVFAAVYAGFAAGSSRALMWLVFIVYGAYTALTSGAERAFIAEIAPPHLKGTMLGLQSTVTGTALLPASALAGILWDSISPAAPFVLGAALSAAAAAVLAVFIKADKNKRPAA